MILKAIENGVSEARITPRQPKGLSDEQMALMERVSASLAHEFKVAEQTYGADNLDLVLATGYLSKLSRKTHFVDQSIVPRTL